MIARMLATVLATALALGLFFIPPIPNAVDTIIHAAPPLVSAKLGGIGLISPAQSQPGALTPTQSDALDKYNDALNRFKFVLSERRAQINAHEKLPDRPGQALYLARLDVMSDYKDLSDLLPSRIGRPNKFGIPPAYFDADNEPIIDEYLALFAIMQAPPSNAQNSDTPFADVVDLGTDIGRAKGLNAADAEVAGRI